VASHAAAQSFGDNIHAVTGVPMCRIPTRSATSRDLRTPGSATRPRSSTSAASRHLHADGVVAGGASATPAKSTEVATTPRVTAVTPTPGSRPQIPRPTSTTLRPVSLPDATIRPAGTPPPTVRVTAYAFVLATDQYLPFRLSECGARAGSNRRPHRRRRRGSARLSSTLATVGVGPVAAGQARATPPALEWLPGSLGSPAKLAGWAGCPGLCPEGR
jgi:hypothetical protein